MDKSTWINGIANYAKHDTLKDAIDDPEFTVLIPSRQVYCLINFLEKVTTLLKSRPTNPYSKFKVHYSLFDSLAIHCVRSFSRDAS